MDRMLALLPTNKPPGILFQALYLNRLSQQIRDHLATQTFSSAREMGQYAKWLWDARRSDTAAAAVAALSLMRSRPSSPTPSCFASLLPYIQLPTLFKAIFSTSTTPPAFFALSLPLLSSPFPSPALPGPSGH